MRYCAVSMNTESGDLYTFLVDYVQTDEIPVRLEEYLGEEMAYVYKTQVDSGVDALLDDEIVAQIQNFIDNMEK